MAERVALDGGTPPGTEIASLTMPPITRHTLALYCGASGDHNPIHVDIDFAKRAGFPDVFAHGMLVMAYLGNLLTHIAPVERHRSFSTRFQAITQLGDEITCTATLQSIDEQDGVPVATLALTARNQTGEVKLAGDAVVALAEGDDR
ncbi:MaoC family dehydratase [Sphingosinicella xenopeptidilytica]|uniref:MaoC family dehydratase n=1 Tax=Sphingosinicella xenopeptidilytica TaxID=364098 RepID=A0ABW3C257_SPHXN